jgi:hypothetical protein
MGGHVAQICEVTHAYNILLGTSEGRQHLDDRHGLEDIIKSEIN